MNILFISGALRNTLEILLHEKLNVLALFIHPGILHDFFKTLTYSYRDNNDHLRKIDKRVTNYSILTSVH